MQFKTSLRDYQLQAVNKLCKVKVGALYMEMGTGKTRTALELIQRRLAAGKVNHVIWLCPCNCKVNLAIDINKHVGLERDLIDICGIETLSSSTKENIRLLQLTENRKCYLIVDESNLVKNPKALRTENITRLARNCQYKLILNGTPIARNEADLFAQWYLLDWRILGYRSFYGFANNHLEYDEKIPGKIKRVLDVDNLTNKIAPYSYQIAKKDVLELKQKRYISYAFSMTDEQSEAYYDTADKYMAELDEMRPTTIYRLFNALQIVLSGRIPTDKFNWEIFDYPYDNPRIKQLMEIIDKKIGDEQAIIFCKYTYDIKIVADLLGDKAVEFYGEMSAQHRQNSILQFNRGKQFLIANKTCAGYGLNLQFCRNVIFYSNDWDFATRLQAEDRVHRIGQEHEVIIYDIYCAASLDVKIMDCLNKKEKLSNSFKHDLKDKNNVEKWIRGE